jgi:hypothetical protein
VICLLIYKKRGKKITNLQKIKNWKERFRYSAVLLDKENNARETNSGVPEDEEI